MEIYGMDDEKMMKAKELRDRGIPLEEIARMLNIPLEELQSYLAEG